MKQNLILIIFLIIKTDTVLCLTQQQVHLADHLLQSNPRCTVVSYKLGRRDANKIGHISRNPLITITSAYPTSKLQDELQEMLSVRHSSCVVLFSQKEENGADYNLIDRLLSWSKNKVAFIFHNGMEMLQSHVKPFFVLIQSNSSGNLILTIPDVDNNKARRTIWLGKTNTLLIPDSKLNANAERTTVRGKTLTVSAVSLTPYVVYLPNKTYGGVDVDLVDLISKKMGFHFKIREEQFWVSRDPVSGNWTGSMGSVYNGLSQIGLTLSINSIPLEYTPQLYDKEYIYMVPRPKLLEPFYNFVRPFTALVWLLFITSLIATFCIFFLLKKLHGAGNQSLGKFAFDLFGTMWQQRLEDTLKGLHSGSFFVLLSFWMICMTFKGAAYNCNLRSYIVKKIYELPVEKEEDLLTRHIDVYIPKGTSLPDYYMNSELPVLREIYARAVAHNTLYDFRDKVSEVDARCVREGGARIALAARNIYSFMNYEKQFGYNPFVSTKFVSFNTPCMMGMPKYQQWTDEFNTVILYLLGAGIVNYLIEKRLPVNKYSPWMTDNDDDVLEPYRVEHVAGPLILLGSALALSAMVACFEVYVAARFGERKRNSSEEKSTLRLVAIQCSNTTEPKAVRYVDIDIE